MSNDIKITMNDIYQMYNNDVTCLDKFRIQSIFDSVNNSDPKKEKNNYLDTIEYIKFNEELQKKGVSYSIIRKINDFVFSKFIKPNDISINKTDAFNIQRVEYNQPIKKKDNINQKKSSSEEDTTILKSDNYVTFKEEERIILSCYTKWKKLYKNSNFDKFFYAKLYDIIKELNCEIDNKSFNKAKYSSKQEQTFDEVIAILSVECQLNSNSVSKNKKYYGMFQLGETGLKGIKQYVDRHPNDPDIKKVNPEIDLKNDYIKLSPIEQLDYMKVYLKYAKEASRVEGKKITPAQLWTLIKLPEGRLKPSDVQSKDKIINDTIIVRNSKAELFM